MSDSQPSVGDAPLRVAARGRVMMETQQPDHHELVERHRQLCSRFEELRGRL